MKSNIYLYCNNKMLSGSRSCKYSSENFIEMNSFIADSESLSILKDSFIYDTLITVVIDDKENDKKYIGECVIIDIPNKEYSDLEVYKMKTAIKSLSEVYKSKEESYKSMEMVNNE